MCGLHAGQFDGRQVSRDCLYRCSAGTAQVESLGAQPSQEGSQPHSPSQNQTQFICPLCPRERPTRVQLPALQTTNARFTPGRGTAFLKNSGDRYKRHAARIDMVSVTSGVTFTRTSADTREGAIEHPQIPYSRILVDWVASPLQEIQPRSRPLQRKVPTKANSFHQAYFCRGE